MVWCDVVWCGTVMVVMIVWVWLCGAIVWTLLVTVFFSARFLFN